MTTTQLWPPLPPDELLKAEEESLARTLDWLVESLQETLESVKTGLEECYALLAPVEPGSTLVISSTRSEYVKGHVTRVGTQIVKGSLHLKLRTLPYQHLTVPHTPPTATAPPSAPVILSPLLNLRTLLNTSLDCVDITRWTGPRTPFFLSSQLRLLHSLLHDSHAILKGTPLPTASTAWIPDPIDPAAFAPPLPPTLALDLSVHDASLVLVVRSLEAVPEGGGGVGGAFGGIGGVGGLAGRFAAAMGVGPTHTGHDEVDRTFVYAGKEMRVREKVRVESADPSLMAVMAKLTALEYTVGVARRSLSVVMGEEGEEGGEDM